MMNSKQNKQNQTLASSSNAPRSREPVASTTPPKPSKANRQRKGKDTGKPALSKTPPKLSDVTVRLSTQQSKHLWDLGYRFDDLRATLKIAGFELPATVRYPSNVNAVTTPKISDLEPKTPIAPGHDQRTPLESGWLPMDLNAPSLNCPCIRSGAYKTGIFPDKIEAMCDHFWHDLTFIRTIIDISDARYFFDSANHQWLGRILANGRTYTESALQYRTALLNAVTTAYSDNLQTASQPTLPTIDCIPNMNNSDSGFASQDGTGPDQLEAIHDANVALTMARGESTAITAEIPKTNVKHEYYSEQPAIFPHLTDRDIALPAVQWATSSAAGAIIASFDLPYDVLAANLTSPNYIPFQTYAQCEPQMTIRAQLQSVPANGGHLVVGVRYAALDEISNDSAWALKHTAQLVQTNHIILSAQSSNSSEIQIPFEYFLDRIPTTWNSQSNMLYYCTLYVGVLNPLVVGPESPNFVNLNLYCSFQCNGTPTRFFGQRNFFDPFASEPTIRNHISDKKRLRKIIPASPNGGVISTASNVVQSVAPIFDIFEPGLGTAIGGVAGIAGDIGAALPFAAKSSSSSSETAIATTRPLLITDHPQIVLTQSHGLALATAPLDAKSMRLQKTYATPQPAGRLETINHLSNKYICSVHGIQGTGAINTTDLVGRVIFDFNVTPVTGIAANGVYYPTPMGAMSMLYTNYSGTMKMTIIVGSSLMHSCRIRAVYIPDYSAELTEGLDPLESRNNFLSTVFDLQEQTQFTFEVPYQVLTPMAPIWETSFLDSATTKPLRFSYGRVRLILETPLKANSSVSSTVYFTVLMSAGESFQLAIPRSCVYPPIPNSDLRLKRQTLSVRPNMEERFNDATLVSAQPSGSSGIPQHIGERHDISDLIHRYSIIAEDSVTIPTDRKSVV